MILDELGTYFSALQSKIENGPITPGVTAEELRRYLSQQFGFKDPLPLDSLISEVEKMLESWQVQVTHPRYFGLFNPSVTLASVIADTLVAMYNPQLANWRTSPVGNEIERHTLGWLASKLGLPADCRSCFTSGGSEANMSAVVVALTRAFPSYGEDGLRSLPKLPLIYVTNEVHYSFNKIAHLVGLGRRNLRVIRSDSNFKMDVADLTRCVDQDLKNGFAPFMVVGTAGTTAAGAIDPLPEIAAVCRKNCLWFHVDAAWGGSAAVSPQLAPYLRGIELADSVTCDAHKWLSVPMGSGMFFCRHPENVAQAFRADVSYMPTKPSTGRADLFETFDPFTNSAQWSRRFIGLKLFMSIANLGERGLIDMVEHQASMGDLLRDCLLSSGWQIINSTPLPLVCFTRPNLVPGRLLASMREEQVAWMSEAELDGIPVMRACITSFRTTPEDIHWVVAQMDRLFAQELARSTSPVLETVKA